MYYLKRGFHITILHVDGEFAPLQSLIQDMQGGPRVNLSSANEHVTEIDRRIRVAKEKIRSIRYSLPFNKVPKLFLIHLVFQEIKVMNHVPVKSGISDTIIPTTIVTGKILHYKYILVYRLDSTVNYTRNTLLVLAISQVPKVPYAWDQSEIYKGG